MRASSLPERLAHPDKLSPDTLIERGGSAILAPYGRYLPGPVFD
jgi:hypothetical protein